jgi:hypothetical protein
MIITTNISYLNPPTLKPHPILPKITTLVIQLNQLKAYNQFNHYLKSKIQNFALNSFNFFFPF